MTRSTRRFLPVALVAVCAVLATAPAAAQGRIKLDRALQSRAARGGQTTRSERKAQAALLAFAS